MHFLDALSATERTRAFSDAKAARIDPVRLPRDELRHPHTMEWWYFIAYLKTATGGRASLLCSAIRKEIFGLASASNCILKVWGEDGKSWPFIECGQPFAAGYSQTENPVSFRIDYRPNHPFRATCFQGGWVIEGKPGDYQISGEIDVENLGPRKFHLRFLATRPAVLLGGNGVMDYGGGYQLAYYVRPKIAVTGGMQLDGPMEPVTGTGWYERQWGAWPGDKFGWKYLNIHLEDGEQWLIFSSFRNGLSKRLAIRFPKAGGSEEYPLEAAQFRDVYVGPHPSGTDVSVSVGGATVEFRVRANEPDAPSLDSRYPMMPAIWEGVSTVECKWPDRSVTGIAMTEIKPYE